MVGFEPTCRLITDKTISSRSRYDLFDTSPYEIFKKQHAETLCRKTARWGFLKMHSDTEKPQCLCGIVREGRFIYASVSSQPRYDHFDTSPYNIHNYNFLITVCQGILYNILLFLLCCCIIK